MKIPVLILMLNRLLCSLVAAQPHPVRPNAARLNAARPDAVARYDAYVQQALRDWKVPGRQEELLSESVGPAGSVWSCADDLTAWMQCMLDSAHYRDQSAEITEQHDVLHLSLNNTVKATLNHWHFDTFQAVYQHVWEGRGLLQFELNIQGKVEQINWDGTEFKAVKP